MNDEAPTRLPHVLLAACVAGVMMPGLGYRHLWVDEVDTGERARSILAYGYPKVIDPDGQVSLNTGGLDIEDGLAHRYIPWGMYYFAALGLAAGEALGVNRDAALRMPSVLAHAATSGFVSFTLASGAGVGVVPAVLVGGMLGLQSVRMVYARQARYQALVELLLVIALMGLALARQGRLRALWLVAIPIAALPHVHTLGGSVVAACLGVLLLLRVVDSEQRTVPLREAVLFGLLPGVIGLVSVVVVTRPWLQTHWGALQAATGGSSLDNSAIAFSLLFAAVSAGGLWLASAPMKAIRVGALLLAVLVLVGVLDNYSKSNPRYYLALSVLFLLWPIATGLDGLTVRQRRIALAGVMLFTVIPDVIRSVQVSGTPWQHQGLRLVVDDWQRGREGVLQPLHRVVEHIRTHGRPDDPVLFDAVPQFGNWYLPGHRIALLPDLADKTPVNADNPLWDRAPPMPVWHVWFPSWGSGPWSCTNRCDYRATYDNPSALASPYVLSSKRLGRSVRMCPIAGIPTSRLNNAPYEYLATAVLAPEGPAADLMVLARRCDEPDVRPP